MVSKKSKNGILFFCTVAVVIIAGAYLSAAVFQPKPLGKSETSTCSGNQQTHSVEIKNNAITPSRITAKLCDTLQVTNKDEKYRLIAFGEHENHRPYNGISEKGLAKDQSFSVRLNQSGNFLFHDHFDESLRTDFTVY
jgi:hypothetical protein